MKKEKFNYLAILDRLEWSNSYYSLSPLIKEKVNSLEEAVLHYKKKNLPLLMFKEHKQEELIQLKISIPKKYKFVLQMIEEILELLD